MKVKIIKCSKSSYWYNDKIGEIYEIDDDFINKDGLTICRTSKSIPNYINFDDCEVLNDRNDP